MATVSPIRPAPGVARWEPRCGVCRLLAGLDHQGESMDAEDQASFRDLLDKNNASQVSLTLARAGFFIHKTSVLHHRRTHDAPGQEVA